MDKLELQVATRQVLGKKVKSLRRNGITPVHVFGPGIKSLALQVDTPSLEGVLKRAGSTGLISLIIDESKRSRNVVAAVVQRKAVTSELLHVDFLQVRMKEAITVEIPLKFVGESPVAKSKIAKLLKSMTSVSVECMPSNIPSSIEVDISQLDESSEPIFVKDLKLVEGVKLLTNPDGLVANVYRPRLEVEEEVVEEVAEEVAVAEPAEVVEGEKKEGEASEQSPPSDS